MPKYLNENNILVPYSTAANTELDLEPRSISLPPHWVRSPNMSQWKPGDIILVRTDESVVSETIEKFQKKQELHDKSASQWTHAAIYLGNGYIIESVHPQGVRHGTIWNYLINRAITVVRHKSATNTLLQEAIAKEAQLLLGKSYAPTTELFRIYLQRVKVYIKKQPKQIGAFICSDLCEYAIYSALFKGEASSVVSSIMQKTKVDDKWWFLPPTPAQIADSTSTEYRELKWCRVYD